MMIFKKSLPTSISPRICFKRSTMTEIVKRRQTYKPWNEEELTFLEDNRGQLTTVELADAMGRTRQSILHKTRQLNIHLSTANGYVTGAELARQKGVETRTYYDWLKKGQIPSIGKVGRYWRL